MFRSHAADADRPPQPDYSTPNDEAWLQQHLTFESSPDALIAVEMQPAEWGRLVIPLRDFVAAGRKLHEKNLLDRDRANARANKPGTPRVAINPFAWRELDRGLLPDPLGKHTPFIVSTLTADRALAIVNAIVLATKARGWKASIADTGALVISISEAEFHLRLRERQAYEFVKRKPPFDMLGPKRKYRPTDRLALVIERPHGENIEVSDGARRLEDQLQGLFPRLYRAVARARRHEREMKELAIRQQRYEEERRMLAERRAHEEAARKAAAEREAQLLGEASRWHQAKHLRAYVAAASKEHPDTTEWQVWALTVANKLDPMNDSGSTFRITSP